MAQESRYTCGPEYLGNPLGYPLSFAAPFMSFDSILAFFEPYRFSVLAVTVFPLAAAGYALGYRRLAAAGQAPGVWRATGYYLGLALCYIALHTQFDYYGQFVFFLHRAQHLILHHLGALLIALGNPIPVLSAALPRGFPRQAAPVRWMTRVVRVVQQPVIASVLFVGLIAFWLEPSIHFAAMLSQPLYLLMNWSMLVDGVLFWLVLMDPRPPEASPMPSYRTRFLMIFATIVPQLVIGAYIFFSSRELFTVYGVCGRALPISGMEDQQYGGLITWIPPAMMGAVAMLIVLSMLMKRERALSAEEPAARAVKK